MRWLALLPALLGLVLGAPPALAGAHGLPAMGVPLATLLQADPGLAGGLTPAGIVNQAGAASATTLPAVAASSNVGSIVQVRSGHEVLIHATPGGRVVETLDDRSDTGAQPRAFTVYQLGAGGWLGVSVPAMDGHLGWIHADPGNLIVRASTEEIHVSLSHRTLTLLREGRVVMHTLVVIGAPGSPTPVGHFSVDDKRRFTPASPAYGAGALALSVPPSGHSWQTWRVAIHGVNNLGRLGGTGSEGCVHVPPRQLARLLRSVPVGTPVDITA